MNAQPPPPPSNDPPPPPPPPPGDVPLPPPPPPPGSGAPPPAALSPEVANYPVGLDVDHQPEYSRLYPLVKWLAVIPNVLVLVLVSIAALIVHLVAWFAVVITGRYPEGMFNFVVGVMRWGVRVNAYLMLMTDRYPPFSTKHDPQFPVRLTIERPDRVERWRPLFAWFLAIPYLLVLYGINILANVIVFLAFFAILFTKKFPKGMFDIALVSMRWQARGIAYAYFLVTRYPPWVWG